MKMRQYGLSEARVRRIIHSPKRVEEGIAPKTIAFMQPVASPKHPYELWTMIVEEKSRRKVISAWKYPGITKPGAPIVMHLLEEQYGEYIDKREVHTEEIRSKMTKSKWFKPKLKVAKGPANLLVLKHHGRENKPDIS